MKRILAVAAATAAVLSIGLVAPAQARDTGWDCPGCRHAVHK